MGSGSAFWTASICLLSLVPSGLPAAMGLMVEPPCKIGVPPVSCRLSPVPGSRLSQCRLLSATVKSREVTDVFALPTCAS